jgi:hypothetical protein
MTILHAQKIMVYSNSPVATIRLSFLNRRPTMKMQKMIVPMLLVAGLVLSSALFAQPRMKWMGSGGWGTGTPYGRMYDPKTEETIAGAVESIAFLTPMKGMGKGVHVILRTSQETISVHLGPAWFLQNQDLKIEKGDRIEVRGSRITFQQKPAIIAAEIKRGDETLMLRDSGGIPLWSGWRGK